MERDPVKSSNIVSIGYDKDANRLEVEFKSGGVYQYHGVTQEEYDSLMGADSIGSFFHSHIRSQYLAHKQHPEEEA